MSTRIIIGDARDKLAELPDESVDCVVTSPPYYGLRDYGVAGQIGLEASPDEYVSEMVAVCREVRRVLRSDGTLWLNIGDSYATSAGKGANVPQTKYPKNTYPIAAPHRRPGNPDKNGGVSNRDGVGAVPGCKPKDLIGIPWMLAFALRADGWWLRQDIIWSKPNPMPESVTDRCTKAHEYLFLLSKSERYFYDPAAIAEPISDSTLERWGGVPAKKRPDGLPTVAFVAGENTCGANAAGRNKRSVWSVATAPYSEAHFATFPPALIEPCILAGCPKGGTVLDPFFGAGTTGLVADRLGRNCIGIELNPVYAAMAQRRIDDDAGMFAETWCEAAA